MIEMKITANNVLDLHAQIRAMLPDQSPSTGPIIDSIASEEPKSNAGVTVNPDGSMTIPAEDKTGLGFDSVGHPWDERIHSTARNKNNDGTWKIVRRPKRFDENPLDWKIYIKNVLAELDGTALNDQVTETENPEPQEDPATVFGQGGSAHVNQQTTTTSSAPIDLTSFLMYMTTNSDKITTEQVRAICQKYGVPELMVLYEPIMINDVPNMDHVALIFSEVEATINAHG